MIRLKSLQQSSAQRLKKRSLLQSRRELSTIRLMRKRIFSPVTPSLLLWDTLTTVRPHCSTLSATPRLQAQRQAVSHSISAHTEFRLPRVKSHSLTPPVTLRLLQCVQEVQWLRILQSLLLPLTTVLCPRQSRL